MFNKQFNIQANPLYSIIYLSSATAHHKSFRIIFSLFSTAVYLPFQSHASITNLNFPTQIRLTYQQSTL